MSSEKPSAFAIDSLMSEPVPAALPPPPYVPGQAPVSSASSYFDMDWTSMAPQPNGCATGLKGMEGETPRAQTAHAL
jgi:hypothetical protein